MNRKKQIAVLLAIVSIFTIFTAYTSADQKSITNPMTTGELRLDFAAATPATVNRCGSATNGVVTSINLGCRGEGNPVIDLLFALIRFLSDGVGLVIIGSLIIAGIQFSSSRGDPGATANAIKRIRSTIIALLIYIFAYAILNFVIPAGIFS